MKYIKLFEKFTKDYMKKIDLKDFKKIKKGSKILYMGGQVEVLDNNGYVLKLKGEDGKTFTVNKSQFDHGGMIREVNDGKKKKKKKPFHPDMMYEAKGKKVISDLYKMDAQIDYLSDADDATKKIWKKAGVNPEDDDMIILYSYVNSWPETKKLLDKSRIKYKELEDPNSAGESFIVFNVNEGVNELRSDMISGTSGRRIESLEDRKYELKKDVKGAQIGDFTNVTLPKGTIIYNLPGGVFADHFSLKNKYASRSSQGPKYFNKPTFSGISIRQMPDILAAIEKNSKVLESFNTEITEAKLSIIHKAAKKGSYPVTLVATMLGKVIAQEEVATPQLVPAAFNMMQGAYPKATISVESKTGQTLFVESVNEARAKKVTKQMWKRMNDDKRFDALLSVVKDPDDAEKYIEDKWEDLPSGFERDMVLFELSSAQDGTKDSDGKHKHEHHLEEDIEAMWKKAYGENFSSQYPAVAKIIKQRKIKDKREIARIWQDTYGEDFEKEYPALYQKLS